MNLLGLLEDLARRTQRPSRRVDRTGDDRRHERPDPARRRLRDIRHRDQPALLAFGLGQRRQVLRLVDDLGRQLRDGFDDPLRGHLHRRLDRRGDATALLLAFDLLLRLQRQPRTAQLLLGLHRLDRGAHLGLLHRDRGIGFEVGAFGHGACRCSSILRRLRTRQPQQKREQEQRDEQAGQQRAQHRRTRAVECVGVHRQPPRAEAAVRGRRRGVARLRELLLLVGNGGVQRRRHPVAFDDCLVELPLGVCEKLFRRAVFGPGAGHTGDVCLRAGRRRVELAARHDQRLVATAAGVDDGVVQCGARLLRPLQIGRRGHDGGCRIGGTRRLLGEAAIAGTREDQHRDELADDDTHDDRGDRIRQDARPRQNSTETFGRHQNSINPVMLVRGGTDTPA